MNNKFEEEISLKHFLRHEITEPYLRGDVQTYQPTTNQHVLQSEKFTKHFIFKGTIDAEFDEDTSNETNIVTEAVENGVIDLSMVKEQMAGVSSSDCDLLYITEQYIETNLLSNGELSVFKVNQNTGLKKVEHSDSQKSMGLIIPDSPNMLNFPKQQSVNTSSMTEEPVQNTNRIRKSNLQSTTAKTQGNFKSAPKQQSNYNHQEPVRHPNPQIIPNVSKQQSLSAPSNAYEQMDTSIPISDIRIQKSNLQLTTVKTQGHFKHASKQQSKYNPQETVVHHNPHIAPNVSKQQSGSAPSNAYEQMDTSILIPDSSIRKPNVHLTSAKSQSHFKYTTKQQSNYKPQEPVRHPNLPKSVELFVPGIPYVLKKQSVNATPSGDEQIHKSMPLLDNSRTQKSTSQPAKGETQRYSACAPNQQQNYKPGNIGTNIAINLAVPGTSGIIKTSVKKPVLKNRCLQCKEVIPPEDSNSHVCKYVMKFKCPFCPVIAPKRQSIIYHRRQHHFNQRSKVEVKKKSNDGIPGDAILECNMCKKRCTTRRGMKDHIKHICGKNSNSQNDQSPQIQKKKKNPSSKKKLHNSSNPKQQCPYCNFCQEAGGTNIGEHMIQNHLSELIARKSQEVFSAN